MRVFLEELNKTVEIQDGLEPQEMERQLRGFYTPEQLYGATTFEEREGYRVRKGRSVVDDGKLWYGVMDGSVSLKAASKESQRLTSEFTKENDEKHQAHNWPEKFAGATTELAPYMFDSAIQGTLYGEAFGAAAAGAALVGGQAGPQAAFPEELITVPAAWIGGRMVGQAWGTWMNAAKVEGGSAYKAMIENGIDPETARNFALPAGYLIGAIELLQIERLIPSFGRKGITTFLAGALKKSDSKVAKFLRKPAVILAKNLAKTTAIETTQELSQEVVSAVAEVGAGLYEAMSEEEGYKGPDAADIKERLKETLTSSLLAFPLLGLPASVYTTANISGKEKFSEKPKTKEAKAALEGELSDLIEETSKIETFQEFQEMLSGETVEEGVAAPVEFSDADAQSHGFDNRILFEEAVWNASREVRAEDAIGPEVAQAAAEEEPLPSIGTPEEETQLPAIVLELKQLTEKVNALRAKGKAVPDSLLKRQQMVEETFKNLRPAEEGKPSRGLKRFIREKTGQVEAAPKMVSEMRALKESLRAQARSALNAAKVTKQELKALKTNIVQMIKEIVPREGQREFLSLIANAQNGRDMLEAITRIERIAEKVEKRQMLRAIKKQLKRVEASKSISIDYVKRISDFLSQYELKGHKAEALKSLRETEKFIEAERQAGRSVELPAYVLEDLKVLSRTPLDQLNAADLKDILVHMKMLAELGKTKLRSRRAADKMMKSVDLLHLMRGSRKVESREIAEGDAIRGKLKLPDTVLNAVKRLLNIAQEKDMALTPIDSVMDHLDGEQDYQGPNYRIFKRRFDRRYSMFLDERDGLLRRADEKADALSLDQDSMDRIGLHAVREQAGGMDKLLAIFTKKEIESVKLAGNELAFYDWMRKELDLLRPQIERVMREVYNAPLGEVKNYFPFMMDFDAMSAAEMQDRFGDKVIIHGVLRKNVEAGFTKKRVGGKYKLKLNASEIFSSHVDNALYLIHLAGDIKYLGELAATEEYRNAVGDVGQEIVRDWIDLVARKGGVEGRIRFLDSIKNYIGVVALGFRISSALVQITSLMDGAALIGSRAFDGFRRIIISPEARAFVIDNMPEVRDRIAEDPALSGFSKKSKLHWLTKLAYLPLKTIDTFAASGVAFGAYLKYLDDNGLVLDMSNPNSEAIEYAQQITRRTQSTSQFKDLPLAISKGKLTGSVSFDKTLLQFQSFMLSRWALIRHNLWRAGVRGANKKQAISIAMWLVAANFAENGIRRWTKEMISQLSGEEPPEEDEDKEFLSSLGQVLQNIPFVGSAYYSILYGDLPVPSVSMLWRMSKRLSAAVLAGEENNAEAKWYKFILSTLPGGQQFEKFVAEE